MLEDALIEDGVWAIDVLLAGVDDSASLEEEMLNTFLVEALGGQELDADGALVTIALLEDGTDGRGLSRIEGLTEGTALVQGIESLFEDEALEANTARVTEEEALEVGTLLLEDETLDGLLEAEGLEADTLVEKGAAVDDGAVLDDDALSSERRGSGFVVRKKGCSVSAADPEPEAVPLLGSSSEEMVGAKTSDNRSGERISSRCRFTAFARTKGER